jgi:hypothetical protein
MGQAWSKNVRSIGICAAIAVGFSLAALAPGALATPDNDSFAARTHLAGELPVFVSESNDGATSEDGEDLGREATGHSIWWRWTAPVSELVTITACESDFPTLLGVFEGGELATLRRVDLARRQPGPGCRGGGDEYDFYAHTGTSYSIGVDGNGYYAPGGRGGPLVEPPSGEGRIKLRLEPTP